MTETGSPNPPRSTGWFDEAKLGIFIHWNPAAIPAYAPARSPIPVDGSHELTPQVMRRNPFADMYWNSMHIPGSPTERYHEQHHPGQDYASFVARFRDEVLPAWDPAPWADLFARAGARYVVLTTKMDDGFLLWPSEHRNPQRGNWQSERDVVGDLAAAVREKGLRFATYYCGGQDWTFTGLPLHDPEAFIHGCPQGEDYARYADAHWHEIIERYRPSVLWNDYAYPAGSDVGAIVEHHRRRVPDGLVNDRFQPPGVRPEDADANHFDFHTPEQTTTGQWTRKWEACLTLGTAWGYNRMEVDAGLMTSTTLIHTFVDIVARGGNLLLNVGPTATGQIPWMQARRLLELGWWIETNAAAIYGTSPWHRAKGLTGEALDVRFTASADAVYAIVLGTPPGRHVEIDVRLDPGATVSLAGYDRSLSWESSPMGTRIRLPDALDDRPAVTLAVAPAAAVHPFDET